MTAQATASERYLIPLDDEEWLLVQRLRDVPPSPLRDRATALVLDLLDFVASPGCPEAQADGVPCDGVHTACDRCARVTEVVESLAHRLGAA
jgi:hypothetical protein